MLEPIFGESGAVIALYLILFILCLGLIWLGYWLFRYYGGGALGSGGKGRAPRLGVVDSLSIDQRHKLVLVRRDNVEHLILIGKTADLVVEPSILRTSPASGRGRQGKAPAQQAQTREAAGARPASLAQAPNRPVGPAPAAAPARAVETGISEPIPVPPRSQGRLPQPVPNRTPSPARPEVMSAEPTPRRAAQRDGPESTPFAPPTVAGGGTAASAHFEEPARPTRIESAVLINDTGGEAPGQPIAAKNAAHPRQNSPAPRQGPASEQRREEIAVQVPYNPAMPDREASSERPVPAAGKAEAETSNGHEDDSATKVSNLEDEMARLLGEITSKRGG